MFTKYRIVISAFIMLISLYTLASPANASNTYYYTNTYSSNFGYYTGQITGSVTFTNNIPTGFSGNYYGSFSAQFTDNAGNVWVPDSGQTIAGNGIQFTFVNGNLTQWQLFAESPTNTNYSLIILNNPTGPINSYGLAGILASSGFVPCNGDFSPTVGVYASLPGFDIPGFIAPYPYNTDNMYVVAGTDAAGTWSTNPTPPSPVPATTPVTFVLAAVFIIVILSRRQKTTKIIIF